MKWTVLLSVCFAASLIFLAYPIYVIRPFRRREKLILDRVGSEPVLLVLGPDNASVRAFSRKLPDGCGVADFYRIAEEDGFMVDSIAASHCNFQGCATDGPIRGACLSAVEAIRDYWFDWREYNPETTVFALPAVR